MAALPSCSRSLAAPPASAAALAGSRRPCRRLPAAPVQAAVRQAVPTPPPPPAQPSDALRLHTPTAVAAAAVAAAVAAGAAFMWRRINARANAPPLQYPGMAGLVRPARSAVATQLDPDYRMALASTRQATAIHRAVGFLNAGERARAYVELRRALHQNSICRAPLLNPGHSKAELCELYRLHLQQSDLPTDFGTLLQLRALLDLDFEEAEAVEKEMAVDASFSI